MSLTRIAEEKVKDATGHNWPHWFKVLDDLNFEKIGHTQAAKILLEEHDVNAWWCQSIAIEYAIAKGLRHPNQNSDGSFSTSASRTIPATVQEIWNAIPLPTNLDETINTSELLGTITKSTPNKILRIQTPTKLRYEYTIIENKNSCRITVTALKLQSPDELPAQKEVVKVLADEWEQNARK